jgi:hypothetical protein
MHLYRTGWLGWLLRLPTACSLASALFPNRQKEIVRKPKTKHQQSVDLEKRAAETGESSCSNTARGPQYEFTRQRRALGIEGLRKAARHAAGMGSQRPDEDALGLLKLAIDRMLVDRWHNGEESGTKYLGWEQLFTSTRFKRNKLVEYWLNDDNAAKWGAA